MLITKCTSKGPIFFKQPRLGCTKSQFILIKFRSMRTDAPQIPPEEDDNRGTKSHSTTGWGKFMRKTSIDEIPQLFNILAGQMSFIGPRPSQMEDTADALLQPVILLSRNAYDRQART
jgi:lipopolysaccharide/colanic/teichoic acid biosynthesis glycosyltransferase